MAKHKLKIKPSLRDNTPRSFVQSYVYFQCEVCCRYLAVDRVTLKGILMEDDDRFESTTLDDWVECLGEKVNLEDYPLRFIFKVK